MDRRCCILLSDCLPRILSSPAVSVILSNLSSYSERLRVYVAHLHDDDLGEDEQELSDPDDELSDPSDDDDAEYDQDDSDSSEQSVHDESDQEDSESDTDQ